MIDLSKLQFDQGYTFLPLTESILISAGQDDYLRCYGPYVLNGKQRYRNYRRTLKSPNAISFVELFEIKTEEAHERGEEMLRKEIRMPING
uniref:Uncharacterized protein n=1 Tax=viral metagenome TaxID=1070528 RepID=A0A6H2A204_9ZZZZ